VTTIILFSWSGALVCCLKGGVLMYQIDNLQRGAFYKRETPDRQYVAWYVESWYYGHHYRFYSLSPWHLAGSGVRYEQEAEAREAVDRFMDVKVPQLLEQKARYD
jgi:hypothetical protein